MEGFSKRFIEHYRKSVGRMGVGRWEDQTFSYAHDHPGIDYNLNVHIGMLLMRIHSGENDNCVQNLNGGEGA